MFPQRLSVDVVLRVLLKRILVLQRRAISDATISFPLCDGGQWTNSPWEGVQPKVSQFIPRYDGRTAVGDREVVTSRGLQVVYS